MKKPFLSVPIAALGALFVSLSTKSAEPLPPRSSVAASRANPTYAVEQLFSRWIFDRARFDDFFNETIDAQIKSGSPKLSDDELQRRRQYLRRTMDEMPSYTFSKPDGSGNILLEISGKDQPRKEKSLKLENTPTPGTHFRFAEGKDDHCEVVFVDRDHITLTIYTAGRAVGVPLIRTIP